MPNKLHHRQDIDAISPWLYLIVAAIIFVLLLGSIPIAMIRLADQGPTRHTRPDSRHIYTSINVKQRMADQNDGCRVFLVGGSSAFYSVRAKTLQSRLGVPVINNALTVGLGRDYIFYLARKRLRAGDTVILFLEYQLYEKGPINWILSDYILPFDLEYFFSRPLRDQMAILRNLSPEEYGLRVFDAVFRSKIDNKYILSRLNRNGDLIDNELQLQTPASIAKLDNSIAGAPSEDVRILDTKSINDFILWCHANEITVIAGYPAWLDFPEYHTGGHRFFFQSLKKYYRSLGVPTLGEPFDYMFPKSMFFNSKAHLHDEAANAMTNQVMEKLKPIMKNSHQACGNTPTLNQHRVGYNSHPIKFLLSEALLPEGIDKLKGFSGPEDWGRWTQGNKASIEFSAPLPSHFRLHASVMHVFKDNSKLPVKIRVGKTEQSVLVPKSSTEFSLDFRTDGKHRVIEIIPPKPQSPKQLGLSADERMLGLGFSRIEITPIASGAIQK